MPTWSIFAGQVTNICFSPSSIYITLLGDKTPAKEHAAVWVPDSEAQFCMHCLKAKFTTMNRRVNIHNIVFAQLLHAHR